MKVVLCCPTLTRPYDQFVAAVEASAAPLDAAGIEHQIVFEVGCPYISAARATMLRKALDAGAEIIVFLDHDLSWRPDDLLRLIQTPGEVVAGFYRFKKPDIEFMGGLITGPGHLPIVRDDGCLKAFRIPAGFMKITLEGVRRFMRAYPHLLYGEPERPHVDLFNHGAHQGTWYGEDYAFSRNWLDAGGDLWVAPDLTLTHHGSDAAFPGNYHQFLLRQPGGSLEGAPYEA